MKLTRKWEKYDSKLKEKGRIRYHLISNLNVSEVSFLCLRTLFVGDTNSSLIADTMGPESFHVKRTVEISMSSAYREVQPKTHIPDALS